MAPPRAAAALAAVWLIAALAAPSPALARRGAFQAPAAAPEEDSIVTIYADESNPRCTLVEGVNFRGANIGKRDGVVGPGACCNLCSRHPECDRWTYATDSNTCFIKRAEGWAREEAEGRISGALTRGAPSAPPPPPAAPTCAEEDNTDFWGGNIAKKEGVAAPGACCALCARVPECHAWTYVRSISRCLLKGAGGFTANASNDRVSGRVARAGAPPSPSPPPPAPAPAVGAAADYPPRLTPAPKAGPFTKAHYGEVLGLSWRFYEAQRSGPLPAGYRVPWRKPSHLADRVVGGWYDAGDYLKLNFVLASSVASLAWGVLEFEGAYAASGQLAHARTNLFAAADYLERCRIGARQYVGQIGHPDIDHDFWGRAEQSAGARPAFVYDASKPAPDLMGKVAAALAASSLVFRPTNATFAAKLLSTARELYAWGAEKPGKYSDYYTTATASIYKSSAWEDDMAWGAYWLHRATGSAAYLEDAHKYWKAKDWGVEPSWDDSGAAVGVAMAALADDGAAVPGAAAFKDYARNRFLRAWAKADGFEQIVKTPGGLVRPSWNKWGNLAMSTSAALVALVQAKHTREPALRAAALQFGRRQVDYALGAGGGRSFVVGWGHNPPLRAHHAGASCPNRPASCDWAHFSAKAPNPQVLYGALVGGPAGPGDATYKDERDDYVTNEVANDYNAGFTGALAGVYELSA